MKKVIGVMGPGETQATTQDLKMAYEVGKLVAEIDAVLLCGGMKGVMETSAQGAQEHGGLTVGIGPTDNKEDMNPYIDIPLVTNMHAGRNYINVSSSDILIFISVGSPGTLSELAHAIQLKKPIYILNASEKLVTFITELTSSVIFLDTICDLRKNIS